MNNSNGSSQQFVDVEIVGQTFCIACDNDNKQSLLDSVDFFNEKISQIIQEIGEVQKKNASPLRLVITATLQIISDFLLTQQVLQQLINQNDNNIEIVNNICKKINKLFSEKEKEIGKNTEKIK